MNSMKYASIALLAGLALASARTAQAQDLAGHYQLTGLREVGSELQLAANGRFQYYLTYGALDQYATGRWKHKGDTLMLLPGADPADPPRFQLLAMNDSNPIKPVQAGQWIVSVGVHGVGPLAGVEVHFRAGDGQEFVAVSAANGDAIAETGLADDAWQRVGVRVAGSGLPLQWFDVQADHQALRLAGVTVDDFTKVLPPPFVALVLQVADDALLMEGGGRYERVQ